MSPYQGSDDEEEDDEDNDMVKRKFIPLWARWTKYSHNTNIFSMRFAKSMEDSTCGSACGHRLGCGVHVLQKVDPTCRWPVPYIRQVYLSGRLPIDVECGTLEKIITINFPRTSVAYLVIRDVNGYQIIWISWAWSVTKRVWTCFGAGEKFGSGSRSMHIVSRNFRICCIVHSNLRIQIQIWL